MEFAPQNIQQEKVRFEKVEDVLNVIDFSLIESILKEMALKSGVSEEDFNSRKFQNKEDILLKALGKDGPFATANDGMIILNTDKLTEFARIDPSKIFSILIHEEVHCSAYNEYSEVKSDTVNGVQRKTLHGSYQGLNEALTEIIAYTAQVEYRQRSGDSTFSPNTHVYADTIGVLGSIAHEIAQKTGVDLDKVMEAFVQAYFTGFDLSSADFFGQLDEDLKMRMKMFGRAMFI